MSLTKHNKMTSFEKLELTYRLCSLVPVGDASAIGIRELMEVIGNDSNSSLLAFKRKLERTLSPIIEDASTGLDYRIDGSKKLFFWKTPRDKSKFKSKFSDNSMTENRALAFHMIDENLNDILPPFVKIELDDDFINANSFLMKQKSDGWINLYDEWQNKLNFHPNGYSLNSKGINEDNHNLIYKYLQNNIVFTAQYESIHESIPELLTLSPQQLQLQNHQLLLVAYIHESNVIKNFEVARLNNIEELNDKSITFHNENLKSRTTKHRFKAHVHTWVKNYFDNVTLGSNQTSEEVSEQTWVIEADIEIPKHFKHDEPDTFVFANMLGMFADAMEVLEPPCLRQEMERRAKQHYSLYLTDENSTELLTRSPHETSGKST